MAGLSSKLGRNKEQAILPLLSQRNIEEAARAWPEDPLPLDEGAGV
jgi:hypothetical protein